MAESAKTLANQQVSDTCTSSDWCQRNVGGTDVNASRCWFQEFMPFRETYLAAFKNDIEYSQLVLQTAAILQSNKFMQVQCRKFIIVIIIAVKS